MLLAGTANYKSHLLGRTKQSQVDRPISVDFVEQLVSDGRASTRMWATKGDRAVLFIIANRPLARGTKKSIKGGRFFKSYPHLLIFL